MEAGRELDALIAERVMGWGFWKSKHGYWNIEPPNGEHFSTYGRFPHSDKYDSVTGELLPEVRWWEYCDELPYYSTSIADAWLVVEKLKDDDLNYFAIDQNYANEGKCGIYFNPFDFGKFPPDIVGDNVPHAICLAALKAVGVKID